MYDSKIDVTAIFELFRLGSSSRPFIKEDLYDLSGIVPAVESPCA